MVEALRGKQCTRGGGKGGMYGRPGRDKGGVRGRKEEKERERERGPLRVYMFSN